MPMSLQSILNAFGDITIGAIEKNAVLKAQAGNFARTAIFYVASGVAAKGWISNDNATFFASLAVAIGLGIYSNLKTRASKRTEIALTNTNSTVGPGDTLPAETAKP